MKFCQPHWDAMRESVKAHRLERFTAKSGEEAHQRLVGDFEGTNTALDSFDPLMGGMFMIARQVGQNIERSEGPLAALQALGDPNWCPLCDVQKAYDKLMAGGAALQAEFKKTAPKGSFPLNAQGWIDKTMEGAVAHAKSQGWELDTLQ